MKSPRWLYSNFQLTVESCPSIFGFELVFPLLLYGIGPEYSHLFLSRADSKVFIRVFPRCKQFACFTLNCYWLAVLFSSAQTGCFALLWSVFVLQDLL